MNEDQLLTSMEEREERKAKRDELKTLKTALNTIKEKLQMKTMRIEDIKETLKKSQLVLTKGHGMTNPDEVIDEVVKEYEN